MAVNSLLDQTIQPNVTYDMDGKGRFNAVSDRSIDMRRYKQITCAVGNRLYRARASGASGWNRLAALLPNMVSALLIWA